MVSTVCPLTLPPTPSTLPANLSSPSTLPSPARPGPATALGAFTSPLPLTTTVALTSSSLPLVSLVSVRPSPTFPIPSSPSKTPLFSPLSPTPLPRAPPPPSTAQTLSAVDFSTPTLVPASLQVPAPRLSYNPTPETWTPALPLTPVGTQPLPTPTLCPTAPPLPTLLSLKSPAGSPFTPAQIPPHLLSPYPLPLLVTLSRHEQRVPPSFPSPPFLPLLFLPSSRQEQRVCPSLPDPRVRLSAAAHDSPLLPLSPRPRHRSPSPTGVETLTLPLTLPPGSLSPEPHRNSL